MGLGVPEVAGGGGVVEAAEVLEVLKVTQTEQDGTTSLPTDGDAEEDADHGLDAKEVDPDTCKELPEAKNEPQELEVSRHDPSPLPALYSHACPVLLSPASHSPESPFPSFCLPPCPLHLHIPTLGSVSPQQSLLS